MSDFESMNDPELEHLERLLQFAAPTLEAGQRERMLYTCGVAAGRAEAGRRVRIMTAASAILGCVAAGLAAMLWIGEPLGVANEGPNDVIHMAGTESPPVRQPRESVGLPIVSFQNSDSLRAGSPITVLADLERRSKGSTSDVGPIEVESTPSLTVSSPFRYEDLIQ